VVIVIDVGVHRGQEMRLLLGDGYSIFFKQILVTCWNELKAGHLRELRPFLIDALKLLSSFKVIRRRAKDWIWIGVDPVVQYDFAKFFSLYDAFYSIALRSSPENRVNFDQFFVAKTDEKEIGGSLFKSGDEFVSRDVISVDAEYFFSRLRSRFDNEFKDYQIILRMNCEGAEGVVIEGSLKVFGSKIALVAGTLADLQKIYGEKEFLRVNSILAAHRLEIVEFSPLISSWKDAFSALEGI
jgi:hypothetical protein